MKDYDFIAMPVIDYQHHLVGIITIDDILDVVNEEADEDYSRLAGFLILNLLIDQYLRKH